jgi:hypothetical protein
MIKNAFKSIISYLSFPKDGTFMVIGNPIKGALTSGVNSKEKTEVIIPVKIDGQNYIPCNEMVRLTIDNVGFLRTFPKYVLVSNLPELIIEDGDLFQGYVKSGEPVRYFYHHRNSPDSPRRNFYISLKNESDKPVKVFLSPIGAGPTNDEIFVGHQALSSYFDYRNTGMGWFAVIKPGTSYILEMRPMKTSETISGVGYVNITEGNGLKFTCYATTVPGSASPKQANQLDKISTQEKPKKEVRTSKGIFPAFIKIDESHEIGNKFTYVYLGGEPFQKDAFNGKPNYGNYGSFYDIDLSIKNPQTIEKEAQIYFIPSGGPARGILEIDGKIIETSLIANAQRFLLKKVSVKPGETQKVKLITMPQGGSYYPVKIVVESEFIKN